MRQILPEPIESIDLDRCYANDERPAPPGRPWLLLNMVASVDGATTVEGRSGGLGSPADKASFAALRAVPDIILVGAATVRAENYGPARLSQARQDERVARGQYPTPTIAVVTGRLDLDVDSRFFNEATDRPLVITSDASPADRRAELAKVAEVIVAGDARVDMSAALDALGQRGASSVLGEGGATLNDQLLAAGLIDELCLTLAPWLVGGDSRRVIVGPTPLTPNAMDLARVIEDDGVLLLRYLARR